jgi:UDP-glucose-4-epimerase GalE
MAKVLVTGGAGYIGSHTVYHLLRAGHDVSVVDDLSRGRRENVPPQRLHEFNLLDTQRLAALCRSGRFDAVIHFAGFIAVGESMRLPELYFRNNVSATISLFEAMEAAGIRRLVFSSSAAVYGEPRENPIREDAPCAPVSPYGESKLTVERLLRWLDLTRGLRSVSLRYFNACGAEPGSGLGEAHEPETHLIPLLLRAVKTGRPATIFGDDYPTPDGTCIRDYIHVSDLAAAHIAALEWLLEGGATETLNVGTGAGHSVRDVIAAVEEATGAQVPYVVGPRRPGDAPVLVADPERIGRLFGWKPRYRSLREMVRTAWEFEKIREDFRGGNG